MNTHEGSEARAVAVRAFKWILSAYEPLTLSELSYAAAVRDDGVLDSEVDNDFVLDICSNFVTIDTSQQPQFVHASVREFLEDLKIDDSKVYSEKSVHTQAAKTCLIYLTSSIFLSAPENSLSTGFPAYVRDSWALHCRACEDNRKEENVLRKSFLGFLSLEEVHPGFRRWHECLSRRGRAPPQQTFYIIEKFLRYKKTGYSPHNREMQEDCLSPEPNPFLVACVFGFLDVIEKRRTEDQAMLKARNSSSRCALSLACKYGHVDIAFKLLEEGASVGRGDEEGNTPLHLALLAENEALVRKLLEAGADVDSEDGFGGRPLYTAIYKCSLPLVRMLLEFKADPNISGWSGTCLELAIAEGHEDIARLLQEAGATECCSARGEMLSSLTQYFPAPSLLSLAEHDGNLSVIMVTTRD